MTNPILNELRHDWHAIGMHLQHHNPYPDSQPAPAPEATMNALTPQLADIRDAASQGSAWHEQLLARLEHFAPILEALESSPIVQALEAAILTPEVEQQVAAIIKTFAAVLPQQPAQTTPAAPDAPEPPAEDAQTAADATAATA